MWFCHYIKLSSVNNGPLPLHCYNSKDCLPVLSGSGAVSFRTEWFFFHKMFPRSRKEYFQKLKHSEWFFHSYLEDIPVSNASNIIINIMLNVISVDLAMIKHLFSMTKAGTIMRKKIWPHAGFELMTFHSRAQDLTNYTI